MSKDAMWTTLTLLKDLWNDNLSDLFIKAVWFNKELLRRDNLVWTLEY